MAQLKHSGGIVEAVIELGFDTVKYFELVASGTSQTLTISPPARRLTVRNTSSTQPFYFNVTGGAATTAIGPIPGDDIKVPTDCTFTMDFDTLTSLAVITSGTSVTIEGTLGWKGIGGC